MADPEVSLVALLGRARNGVDRVDADAALCTLIERLYPLAARFISRRLTRYRDANEIAADVAQESMVRIATGITACRAATDHELVAWVLVTTRRTAVDMYRSPSSGLAARSLAVDLDDGLDADTESEVTDPDEASPRRTLLRLASRAYDALKSSTAELLWWRLIRDAEWSEVAERLETTPAGAKRRFQRAQAAMRRAVLESISGLPSEQRDAVQRLVAQYGIDVVGDGGGVARVEDAA
jgi:RNA polymerase sigma factor (sigma-70 family)